MKKYLIFITFLSFFTMGYTKESPNIPVYKCENIEKTGCYIYLPNKCPEGYKEEIIYPVNDNTDTASSAEILNIKDLEEDLRIKAEEAQKYCNNSVDK